MEEEFTVKLNRRSGYISAGDLKDRCTLQQPTYTNNNRGGQTVTYADYGSVWCKAVPLSDTRVLEQAQETYNESKVFTVRYNSAFQPDWKLTYEGNEYFIHAVENIEGRYQYLKIIAFTKAL